MKTLVMDTAWKNMLVGLYEDGCLVAGSCQEAFKKQSESLFKELKKQLKTAGWRLDEIEDVIITDGPGSYTGLRIAMTVAKILGTQSKARVRTISTFELYAGKAPRANVVLDARGKRVYAGHLEHGVEKDRAIVPLDEIEDWLHEHPGDLFGEGELIGKEACESDFLSNAADCIDLAKKVDSVYALVPAYMKESDRYKV